MTRLTREQVKDEARPKRIPVAEANRDKLHVAGLDHDNYIYRWVNDVPGRLDAFIQGWWEFVDQTGKPVGDGGIDQSASTSSKFSKGVGTGQLAYLMRIPKEFWLEDQDKKEAKLKAFEADNARSARLNADYGKLEVGSRKAAS